MLDLDNTLNNLQETVTHIFNERYGTSYSLSDFTNYNISECISKEDAIKMYTIYNEPGIYDYVKPLPNAQNCVQKLIRAGHEVYIVTQSSPSIFAEKAEWIKFHFPFIDESHIISMEHKWLFRCDVMVEDKLDNLLGGHHYGRICFDQSWNRNVRDEVYDIYRVNGWDAAIYAINKINEEWSDVA